MKVKSHTRITHTLTLDDETEVELLFEPSYDGDMFIERVGDKLVVAYLVQDDHAGSESPMDNHANGNIYLTRDRDSSLMDLSEVLRALQLEDQGVPNPDVVFEIDGKNQSLREHAVTAFMQTHYSIDLTLEWLATTNEEWDTEDEDLAIKYRDELEQELMDGGFKQSEIANEEIRLYKLHWCAIVGPYVIPLAADCYNETNIRPCSWDGDPDDLPEGIWVADKDAIENLTWKGKVPTQDEIVAYAATVCSEYSKWASGEVFGCVCEVFAKADEERAAPWEKIDIREQECWGYIGRDYALETLENEYFRPTVAELKDATA